MGPLAGVKVIEMKGIGPGPYAGMLLADMGADLIVVEKTTAATLGIPSSQDIHSRGKKSIALNLKSPEGLEVLMELVETADIMFEGFRPGVAERLGFGPDACLDRNPRLVYGRMTGWGQEGPLSKSAGHDINYISLVGALAAIGGPDKPVPPLNLVGDYGGGSLFLVMGMLAAFIEAQKSGQGQVIDAAITDGTASLMSVFMSMDHIGQHSTTRHSNLLDGAAHFYDVYETSDGRFISIGSIEPQFYSLLIETTGLDAAEFSAQLNTEQWPALKEKLAAVFKSRTQAQWCELMEGTDICFAPVLNYKEAPNHPHNQARGTFFEQNGVCQPAPAPRFSRTQCEIPATPQSAGEDTHLILKEQGYTESELLNLKNIGAII